MHNAMSRPTGTLSSESAQKSDAVLVKYPFRLDIPLDRAAGVGSPRVATAGGWPTCPPLSSGAFGFDLHSTLTPGGVDAQVSAVIVGLRLIRRARVCDHGQACAGRFELNPVS
jgi:hypothetical protein